MNNACSMDRHALGDYVKRANAGAGAVHDIADSVNAFGERIYKGTIVLSEGAAYVADTCGQAHVTAAEMAAYSQVLSARILGDAIDKASRNFLTAIIWLGIFSMCCMLIYCGYVVTAFAFLLLATLAMLAETLVAFVASIYRRGGASLRLLFLVVVASVALIGYAAHVYNSYWMPYDLKFHLQLHYNKKYAAGAGVFFVALLLPTVIEQVFVRFSVSVRVNGVVKAVAFNYDSVFAFVLGAAVAGGIYYVCSLPQV